MLTQLLLRFFFTLYGGGAIGDSPAPAQVQAENIDAPRVAQVRLAETLASADAIHSVTAKGNTVTFTITRGDALLRVVATTKRGEVSALAIAPATASGTELGGLSWLADELSGVTAITRLAPDNDGAVTITTNDGRRYMTIPGRGSGGNTAVEARWAAEWNR